MSPASLRGVHARDWRKEGDDPDRWVPPVSGRGKERVPLRRFSLLGRGPTAGLDRK
jgi:hypothetical protein